VEFTGERYVPGTEGIEELYLEHMSRYVFASGAATGARVLDIACGCGYGTHYLALCGANRVVGIDASAEAIGFAERHYKHPALAFAVMDAHRLPLRRGFDLVTCLEAIEHVEDAHQVLKETKGVLAPAGLLLVSTPNRITYVAGGEGGRNPFHVREYDRGEFEELLRSVFPHVVILGQHWTEGIVLSSHSELLSSQIRAHRLPEEDGSVARGDPRGEPAYFLGACSTSDILTEALGGLPCVVVHSGSPRNQLLKCQMARLEHDFDERGQWALRLDREIARKDNAIKSLQAEIRALRDEFDKRGRWGRGLDCRLREQESLIRHLADENARLRVMLDGSGCKPGRVRACSDKP
jgi:SAM-dependent methyltransferase